MPFKSLYKEFQEENPEKFNEDLIYLKKKDTEPENVIKHIDNICESLELINGIEYLGSTVETNEYSFMHNRNTQEVNISRLILITMKFKISSENKSEIVEVPLFFPKLVDNYYFILNGSNYFPIFQLVDKDTYVIGSGQKRSLALKTLRMPVIIFPETFEIKLFNKNNEEIFLRKNIQYLKIFNKKINFLYYYLGKFNLQETIKYFELENYISITKEIKEIPFENYYYFIFEGHTVIALNIDLLNEKMSIDSYKYSWIFDFFVSLYNLFDTEKPRFTSIFSHEYWLKKLGSLFTKNINNQKEKAESILISFERILDSNTANILEIPKEEKNMYGTIKWMIKDFYNLIEKDNMNLKNKRIRLTEYILNPLLMKISQVSYRLLNKKGNISFNDLKSVINIKINTIIKKILVSELLRYDNAVNGFDLFTSALRITLKGPQSITSNKSEVPAKYRNIDLSYIGNISLVYSSTNDPGMTRTLTPFAQIKNYLFK